MTAALLSRPVRDGAAPGAGETARRAAGTRRLQAWGPLAVLAALCVIFSVATPDFATVANLGALLDASAIPLILVTGLTFVVLQGSIDLSVEGVMATASMATALLIANSENAHDFGWGAVVFALLASLAFGAANGILHVALRLPTLMVTLGTWFIGLGIATGLYPARQPQILHPGLQALALSHVAGVSPIDWIALVVLGLGVVIQRQTTFGRASYAIGGNEAIARLSGLQVDRFKIGAFVLSAGLAGLAGVLASARLGVGSVAAGADSLFPAVSAIVIGGTSLSGGRGGVLQAAVGVLILQVLQSGLVLTGTNPYLQRLVEGAAIVAAVAASSWRLRRRLRVVK